MRWIALVLLLGLATGAEAQSRRENARQIEDLQARLNELELLIKRPGTSQLRSQGDSPAQAAPAGQDLDGLRELVTDLTVRMQALEDQIAELTGALEQARYRTRQLEERLNRFQEDAEFRFGQLEGTGGPSSAAETAPADQGADPSRAEPDLSNPDARSLAPPGGDAILKGETVDEKYNYAYTLLRRNDFATAEAAFRAFLKQHGESDLAGNAQYWLGETFYVRGQFADAARAFLTGYRNFPDGGKGPDSLLKLGLSLAALDQPEQACAALAEMDRRFPEAPAKILERTARERQRLECPGA